MQNTVPKVNTQYTLILGAEGELGRALAREIARKRCNLILVSTTSIDLQRFAIGLQLKEEVQVEAVKLDLGDQEAMEAFAEKIKDQYEIRALTGRWPRTAVFQNWPKMISSPGSGER